MNSSLWKSYWLLLRPMTLLASCSGSLLGIAAVRSSKAFDISWALMALFFAVVMQMLANVVNDLEDARNGVDTIHRMGPQRLFSLQHLSARGVLRLAVALTVTGLFLASVAMLRLGPLAALLGFVCAVAAWGYSGAGLSLSHRYAGEALAYLFFGVVLVGGSAWLATAKISMSAIYLGCGFGWWAVAIMAINNLRDKDTDIIAGKKTLAHLLGISGTKLLIVCSWLAVLLGNLVVIKSLNLAHTIPAALTLLPALGLIPLLKLLHRGGKALNLALKLTALAMTMHALLIITSVS